MPNFQNRKITLCGFLSKSTFLFTLSCHHY